MTMSDGSPRYVTWPQYVGGRHDGCRVDIPPETDQPQIRYADDSSFAIYSRHKMAFQGADLVLEVWVDTGTTLQEATATIWEKLVQAGIEAVKRDMRIVEAFRAPGA